MSGGFLLPGAEEATAAAQLLAYLCAYQPETMAAVLHEAASYAPLKDARDLAAVYERMARREAAALTRVISAVTP